MTSARQTDPQPPALALPRRLLRETRLECCEIMGRLGRQRCVRRRRTVRSVNRYRFADMGCCRILLGSERTCWLHFLCWYCYLVVVDLDVMSSRSCVWVGRRLDRQSWTASTETVPGISTHLQAISETSRWNRPAARTLRKHGGPLPTATSASRARWLRR